MFCHDAEVGQIGKITTYRYAGPATVCAGTMIPGSFVGFYDLGLTRVLKSGAGASSGSD